MKLVDKPVPEVPQQTEVWCFAAAEQMVRSYYGLARKTQYQIARAYTAARARIEYETLGKEWQAAVDADEQDGELEDGGDNLKSAVVLLVRSKRGSIVLDDLGGKYIPELTADIIKEEIDNNRIFVIGSASHFYVVYGYDEGEDGIEMLVRDPYPPVIGGARTRISLAAFKQMDGRAAIRFPTD